ncbi:hypothetical protein COV11_01325 [Candidatus Woesearchaeota archaeon CG10_big_fil_rev_8_21_14_0_10_30_7]|nr:MAG: hypothetical protein COV11_01325 [Candidatus Woesearchaeota archaeon CG10_big_fil_rev_8_21_14_0_10_30_7]
MNFNNSNIELKIKGGDEYFVVGDIRNGCIALNVNYEHKKIGRIIGNILETGHFYFTFYFHEGKHKYCDVGGCITNNDIKFSNFIIDNTLQTPVIDCTISGKGVLAELTLLSSEGVINFNIEGIID